MELVTQIVECRGLNYRRNKETKAIQYQIPGDDLWVEMPQELLNMSDLDVALHREFDRLDAKD